MKKLFFFTALAAVALSANAQENLLAGKSVYTLGEPKVWTLEEEVETVNVDDLAKLTQVPTNTSNVFLYPEKGALSRDLTNQNVVGIQGIYVDMGEEKTVGSVSTTWEGAAADSYVIYVTKDVPTLDILNQEPDYSVEKLGQYTSHTAVLEGNPTGRYLVFQPTKATNYEWGVKMRSISAVAPVDAELTGFSVSPTIVAYGVPSNLTFSALNQLGVAIPVEDLTITAKGDGEFTYSDGVLTINSGKSVTITAAYSGKSIDVTVYAADAPDAPLAENIKTPIFTNTVTYANGTAVWSAGYNGGAVNNGTVEFSDGSVAQSFGNTRCVFFSNSVTTGDWNGDIFPTELGYETLCLDVFAGKAADGYIEFEGIEMVEGVDKPEWFDGTKYRFTLTPGEWNHIEIDINNVNKLNNMSIRFDEANMCDVLLANLYFSASDFEVSEYSLEVSAVPAITDQENIVVTVTVSDEDGVNARYLTAQYTTPDGNTSRMNLTETEEGSNVFTGSHNPIGKDGEYTVTVSYKDKTEETKVLVVLGYGAPNDYNGQTHSYLIDGEPAEGAFSFGQNGTGVSFTKSVEIQLAYPQDLELVKLNWNYAPENCSVSFKISGVTELCEGYVAVVETADGSVEHRVWSCTSNERVETTLECVTAIIITANDAEGLRAVRRAGENTYELASVSTYGGNTKSEVATGATLIENDSEGLVDVYTLQGTVVRRNVNVEDAATGLPSGLYIIGNKKVLVK